LKFSRKKSVLLLGGSAALLVIACTLSFGLAPFFSSFMNYGGEVKSFFDVIVDIFYKTILPLNGLVVCLFVVYHWRRQSLNNELAIGDDQFDQSLTKKYLNFSRLMSSLIYLVNDH